ncbi:MAG: hypothetical protein AB7K68_04175 [Bacteriovoracia bacterium]
MKYNNLGLRDRDFPKKRKPGVKRLLFVGSSLLVSPGLEDSETLPRLLEKKLRRQGLKVEVINAGVAGHVDIQSYMHLQRLLDAYHPDYVVFMPTVSGSLMRARFIEKFAVRDETGRPTAINMNFVRTYNWIPGMEESAKTSIGWQSLYLSLQAWNRFTLSWGCVRFLTNEARLTQCLLGDALAYAEWIAEKTKQAKAKFLVVAFPGAVNNSLAVSTYVPHRFTKVIGYLTPALTVSSEAYRTEIGRRNLPVYFFTTENIPKKHGFVGDDLHFDLEGTKFLVDKNWKAFYDFLAKK